MLSSRHRPREDMNQQLNIIGKALSEDAEQLWFEHFTKPFIAYCNRATSVVTERGGRIISLSLLNKLPGFKSSSAVVA